MQCRYQKNWRQAFQMVVILCILSATQDVQAQTKKKAAPAVEKIQSKTTKQEMSEHTDDLRTLMQALYEQYPDELAKSTQVGPREMTEWVFDGKANWRFEAIRRQQSIDAIDLMLDSEYSGDHVLALIVGLETLLFDAYGGKNEFEIPPGRNRERLMQLGCQLHVLQTRLEESQTSILNQASSRQLIQDTLKNIIQRIRVNNSSQELGGYC